MMCVLLRDPPLYFGIVFDMLLFREPFSTLLFVYGTRLFSPLSPNALKKSVSLICRNMISCYRGSAACKILSGLTLQAKLPNSLYSLLPHLYQPCPALNPLSRRSISTSYSPHNQHSNPFPVLEPPQSPPLRSLVSKVSRPEADSCVCDMQRLKCRGVLCMLRQRVVG
jgi:hypothetical protein